MESNLILLIAVGVAVLLVGGIFSTYQLYRLVAMDAQCRGLNHPKLWGLLAASGNNQSGLLLYLIGRNKHPILSMTDTQKKYIDSCKQKIAVGLIFILVGAIMCIWGIVLYGF
jgi:succinate dehydrogenase hydrophobic anchor subunit